MEWMVGVIECCTVQVNKIIDGKEASCFGFSDDDLANRKGGGLSLFRLTLVLVQDI